MVGNKSYDRAFGMLVVGIALLVYATSLGNGFVWDDTNVIVTNPSLRGSPLSLFSSIDTTRDYELLPYYRPLTALTFLLEERLHGLIPFPMHLINILLHAANSFLVYRLARTLLENTGAALFAGLLFAVHPINTEAVNFLSGGRNTMLACFFLLTAYLLHRKSMLAKNNAGAVLAAVLLLAGFLSKESALAALPFILALEFPALRSTVPGTRVQAALRLLPCAAALSCYLVLRWMTLSRLGIQTSIVPGLGSPVLQSFYKIPDLWTRLLDNVYILPRYALTLIRPTALSLRYIIPDNYQLVFIPLTIAWLGIGAALGWLLTRGRSQATLFGLVWFAVFYLPISGIVMFPSSPMADRYLYVPAIGLWILIAEKAGILFSGAATRRYSVIAVLLALLVLGGLTLRRNLDWESDITLFSRFAEQYPGDAYSHAGLGSAYFGERNRDSRYLDLAEPEYEKSLALNPLIPGVHANMGYIKWINCLSSGYF